MKLKQWKSMISKSEMGIIINKEIELDGNKFVILGIMNQYSKYILWAMGVNIRKHRIDSIERTNRETLEANMNAEVGIPNISKIHIQGKSYDICERQEHYLNEHFPDSMACLKYFIEKGVDISTFDEYDLNELELFQYDFEEDTIVEIDAAKDCPISLTIGMRSRKVPIITDTIYKMEFSGQDNKRYSFYDTVNHRERYFYLNKMGKYDIWKEVVEDFTIDKFHMDSEEEFEKFKKIYIEALEKICPKGSAQLFFDYESQDEDIELEFYSSDYLNSLPLKARESNEAIGVIVRGNRDNEFGINGYKIKTCRSNPVPVDYDGAVDIELLCFILLCPEETIEL